MKTLTESITQSRRIYESSILSGRKASIENTKSSVIFNYDRLAVLITTKGTFSSEPHYNISSYKDLDNLFNKDVPDILLKLKLLVREGLGSEIKFVRKIGNYIRIIIISSDQTTNLYNTEVLKRWIETGGNRIKEDSSQVGKYSTTLYYNYIDVYKK